MTAEEFEDDGACYPYSDVPEKYENGDVKNWTKGMCGFKFGISNSNSDFDNNNNNMLMGDHIHKHLSLNPSSILAYSLNLTKKIKIL